MMTGLSVVLYLCTVFLGFFIYLGLKSYSKTIESNLDNRISKLELEVFK